MMLTRNFRRISQCQGQQRILAATTSSHQGSLRKDYKYHFGTFHHRNPVTSCYHLQRSGDDRYSIHHHQHRDITFKTIVLSGGLMYLIKKFVGIKLIQWYGWKRIYRLNHRRSRDMMRDLPEEKRAKSRKIVLT